MPECTACGSELVEADRFCSSCGVPVSDGNGARTSAATVAMSAAQPKYSAARLGSSHPGDFDEGRFPAGTLIGERYRILDQVGKGGMGEVYRAQDLRLGQTVALKFLPEATTEDPGALARFYNEVRIARQVTHPNVCRVYDIGELNGQPFLSMQFVDGENLASLLLRIGRLPSDKAVEIARRLCSGLAAAHSQNVLHRDLKPANIMIDGRGQVIITDFGLAGIADDIRGAEIRSGTPAYMSPEQLAGREVTYKSDLYALGLVLYEMFTGRKAFEAATLAELIRLREESRPAEISSVVHEIDRSTERIILKCLDPDPAARPSSALAVAAALPGGDPLAAALAAGETPSPEMVAAAGSKEGLRPSVTMAMAASALALLAIIPIVNAPQLVFARLNLELPPEALAVQARKMIEQSGYTTPSADRAWGFEYNDYYSSDVEKWFGEKFKGKPDWSPQVMESIQPLVFWYRQSPEAIISTRMEAPGQVSSEDPPLATSGMTLIKLDSSGRLLELAAIPTHREESAPPRPPADPSTLFTAAGLDFKTFQPATPQWTGLVDNDQRAAWTGPFPGRPDWIMRVEAAWWHGQPVYFRVVPPWASPPPAAPTRSFSDRLRDYSSLAQSLVFLVGAGLLAWQNWSKGRGDRQGALRLAAFAFVAGFLGYLLDSHSLFSARFFRIAGAAAGSSLWAGMTLWLAYLALEPHVRRQWPQILISWTRVLTGRWRDALVAQHVLAGVLVGLGWCLTFTALIFAGEWLGGAPQGSGNLVSFSGLRFTSGEILDQVIGSLRTALAFFITLFVLRLLVRKEWIAAVLFVLINVVMRSLPNDHPLVLVPPFLIIFSLIVVVLIRFGLLSVVFAIFTVNTLNSLVVTTNFSAWYGNGSLFVLVLFALMCVMAYRHAAGSQSGKPIRAV